MNNKPESIVLEGMTPLGDKMTVCYKDTTVVDAVEDFKKGLAKLSSEEDTNVTVV